VDWVSCTTAAGLASCRSEADGNERRRLDGLLGIAVCFLGGMINQEEMKHTIMVVR